MKNLAAARGLGALALASAIIFSACGGGTQTPSDGAASQPAAAEGRGGTLTLGIIQEPPSWDPGKAHVGHRLQPYQLAYDSLILRGPEGDLQPMLATAWKYTDAARTVLQLDLRTDVKFSDGTPFDAAAVVKNIENFKAAKGPQAGQAADIASVAAVDADTVEITLSQANPAMEYFLSQALGLMGNPAQLGTDAISRVPAGSGPYTMVEAESVVGQQYVFTARDGYWNPELQKWDRIVLKLLADPTARVNAITTGAVDATLLTAQTFDQGKAAGLTPLTYGVDVQGLLIFDREGKLVPALASQKVRQAINYAFDRAALLKQLAGGQGEVTSQFFGTATAAYSADLDGAYPYDPAKAKALLAEAGYADGFEMDMPVIPGTSDTIMTFVAQQLGDIGIKVNQVSVNGADYQGDLGAGKFPAAWFSIGQLPAWASYTFVVAPTALYNPFKVTTPEVDALVARMRTGDADGDAAAKELGKYLVDQGWFAWWFRPAQLYFYDSAKVSVVAQNAMAVPAIYNYSPVK